MNATNVNSTKSIDKLSDAKEKTVKITVSTLTGKRLVFELNEVKSLLGIIAYLFRTYLKLPKGK